MLPERGISVEVAWNCRGFCEDFALVLRGFCEELNPFLFEREREGYKRFADCTVAPA